MDESDLDKFAVKLGKFIRDTPMSTTFPAFMSIVCFQAVKNGTPKEEICKAALHTKE